MVWRSVSAAICLVLAWATPASAERLETLRIGPWSGGAETGRRSGIFEHCTVTARNRRTGVGIGFAVTRTLDWMLAIQRGNWTFTTGRTFELRHRTDGGDWTMATATAINATTIVVRMPRDEAVFARFAKARLVEVAGPVEIGGHRFELSDDPVLPTLRECAIRHARGTPPGAQPPGAQSPGQPRRHAPTPETRQEARAEASQFLARAGITHQFLGEADNARLHAANDSYWRMQGAIGSLRIFPAARGNLDTLKALVIASDAKACRGQFASGSGETTPGAGGSTITAFTACMMANNTGFTTYYATYPRRAGGNYLITVQGTPANRNLVQDLGGKLRAAALGSDAAGQRPAPRTSP